MLSFQLRLMLVAVQFYSRIPVTGRLADWVGFEPAWLARATRYFPLVGVVVASLTAFAYAMCGLWLPHGVALLLAMAAGLLLTGAFHEDGFADFCDGFGGGTTAERTLEIMHDSRIGAYGAIGVAMILLLRFATLESVDPSWIGVTLVTAAAFSRGCSVLVMAGLRLARDETDAPATPIATRATGLDTMVALAFAITPSAALAAWTGDGVPSAVAAGVALAVSAALRRAMRRSRVGVTAGAAGAVQQLAEVGFLLGLLAAFGTDSEPGLEDPGGDEDEAP
jgi:adenosylcobinamide-GDP ribazoletransferase